MLSPGNNDSFFSSGECRKNSRYRKDFTPKSYTSKVVHVKGASRFAFKFSHTLTYEDGDSYAS